MRGAPAFRAASMPSRSSSRAGDGRWLFLLCLQPDRHWASVARALELPETLEDPDSTIPRHAP